MGLPPHPGRAARPGDPAIRDVGCHDPPPSRTLTSTSKRTDMEPVPPITSANLSGEPHGPPATPRLL